MSESKAIFPLSVDSIKKIAKTKRVKTAILAGAVALGATSSDTPVNPPIPTPESTGQSEVHQSNLYEEYLSRIAGMRGSPQNKDAYVWPNLPADDPTTLTKTGYEAIERKRASLNGRLEEYFDKAGMSFEFYPIPLRLPTFRFFKATMTFKGVPVGFIDTSGRFPKDKLTRRKGYSPEEIFKYLPELEPAFYLHPDLRDSSLEHVVGIPAEKIPKNGYVMVFSRPTADEKPESTIDDWQIDTGLFSETLKVKAQGEGKTRDVHYVVTDTRDRLDRLTPFYNKRNPVEVRKVIVIFDPRGQAVGKITLDTTPFLPRDEAVDNNQGNSNLVNQEYLDRHAEQLSFGDFSSMTWQERNEKLKNLVGRPVRLLIDRPDVKLEHFPSPPTQKNHWLVLGAFPDNHIDPPGGIPVVFDNYVPQSLSLKSRETGKPRYQVKLPKDTKLFFEVTSEINVGDGSESPVIRFRGIKYPK